MIRNVAHILGMVAGYAKARGIYTDLLKQDMTIILWNHSQVGEATTGLSIQVMKVPHFKHRSVKVYADEVPIEGTRRKLEDEGDIFEAIEDFIDDHMRAGVAV